MKKSVSRTILFVLIFLLLLGGVTHLLIPKDSSQAAGILDDQAKGFLALPGDHLDAVILGDSEAYTLAIPLDIWEQTGISVYICGSADQKLYQTESYLQRIFREQSPGVVFLETNILYRDFSSLDPLPHWFEEHFPLLRYHDRWKSLKAEDLFRTVEFQSLHRDRGYMLRSIIAPADNAGYMAPTEDLEPVPSKMLPRLRRLQALCLEHGAQLVLISAPSTVNWSYPRHNYIQYLADQMDIPYLDTNLLQEEIPIDWQTDSLDHGDHLNYWGARKVTDYLAGYLQSLNLFQDKRQLEEYAHWNRDLEAYRREIPRMP